MHMRLLIIIIIIIIIIKIIIIIIIIITTTIMTGRISTPIATILAEVIPGAVG